ncbi:MAG: ABC transporter substrate-binding protein [Candidatus Adiutrix sp.]|nr:ABC transporter substrate-binding protein [Candidatus Adiutrix sp.]
MRRNYRFTPAAALMMFLALLCGPEAAWSAPRADLERVELTAGNNSVANMLTALAKLAGYYEEEGLEVGLNVANNNADGFSALNSGKAIATGGGATAPLNLIDEGVDFVIIGGAMAEGATLFTLPQRAGEWEKIDADSVRGKKIGVTRAQSGDIAFRAALARQGLDLKTMEFVELGDCPTIIQGVLKGTLDAGIVFMTFREAAEAQGLAPALPIDRLAPGFICCRVVTTRDYLEKYRPQLVKVLKAQIKAYRLYRTDQEKTLELLKEFIIVGDDVLRSQIYTYGHLTLTPNPAKSLIRNHYEGMKLIGYAKGTADLDRHIDTGLFAEALESVLLEYPGDSVFLELKKDFEATE